jgi:hypothetical protein
VCVCVCARPQLSNGARRRTRQAVSRNHIAAHALKVVAGQFKISARFAGQCAQACRPSSSHPPPPPPPQVSGSCLRQCECVYACVSVPARVRGPLEQVVAQARSDHLLFRAAPLGKLHDRRTTTRSTTETAPKERHTPAHSLRTAANNILPKVFPLEYFLSRCLKNTCRDSEMSTTPESGPERARPI